MNFYDLIGFTQPWTEPAAGVEAMPDLSKTSIFLDFDGTLVDLAERPDAVKVEPVVRTLLANLGRLTGQRTVLVSGRSVAAIADFLPEFEGVIVGSHGAERRGGGLPDIELRRPEGLDCVRAVMEAYASHHEGVLLEDKPFSAVLHFRQVPELQCRIEPMLDHLVREWDDTVVHRAKMAVEVMPEGVSKRDAVIALHETWADTTPVAIGDDRTDEGMLRYAVEQGGIGIKVGEGQTVASRRLKTPSCVHVMLSDWIAGRLVAE